MTSADHYRALAAQFDAKAKQEADWQVRAEWEHMARSSIGWRSKPSAMRKRM